MSKFQAHSKSTYESWNAFSHRKEFKEENIFFKDGKSFKRDYFLNKSQVKQKEKRSFN